MRTKKNFGLKHLESTKNLGPKKMLSKKKSGSQTFWFPNNVRNQLWVQKIMGPKNFGFKKIYEKKFGALKQTSGQKKMLGQKIFGYKGVWSNTILVHKIKAPTKLGPKSLIWTNVTRTYC